jgi:hypothetical protein
MQTHGYSLIGYLRIHKETGIIRMWLLCAVFVDCAYLLSVRANLDAIILTGKQVLRCCSCESAKAAGKE